MGSVTSVLFARPQAPPVSGTINHYYYPPPLDTETAALQRSLEHARQDILCIDEELRGIERVRSRLLVQRQAVQNFVNFHPPITSSFRRLPSEIIGEILLFALSSRDTGRGDTVGVGLNTQKGPWKYGHICRAWRGVVLSFPQLWSKLDISPFLTSRPRVASIVAAELLHRSRDLPLTINTTFDHPTDPHLWIGEVLDVLITHSHRWKDVTLVIPAIHIAKLGCVKGCVPQLETLSLTLKTRWPNPASSLGTFDAFRIAPRLKNLTLDLGDQIPVFDIPWSQLKVCDIVQYLGGQHLCIIPYLHNVIECTFREDSCAGPSHNTTDYAIPLPRLKRLIDETTLFYEFIAAPALEYLDCFVDGDDQDLEAFSAFLARSACHSLEYLDLGVSNLYDSAAFNLVAEPVLDNLTTLLLKVEEYDDCPIISFLTIRFRHADDEDIPLPRLKTLKLHAHHEEAVSKVDTDGLLKMADSRYNAGLPLDVFHFRMIAPKIDLPLLIPILCPRTKKRFDALGRKGHHIFLHIQEKGYREPAWNWDVPSYLPRYDIGRSNLTLII